MYDCSLARVIYDLHEVATFVLFIPFINPSYIVHLSFVLLRLFAARRDDLKALFALGGYVSPVAGFYFVARE